MSEGGVRPKANISLLSKVWNTKAKPMVYQSSFMVVATCLVGLRKEDNEERIYPTPFSYQVLSSHEFYKNLD